MVSPEENFRAGLRRIYAWMDRMAEGRVDHAMAMLADSSVTKETLLRFIHMQVEPVPPYDAYGDVPEDWLERALDPRRCPLTPRGELAAPTQKHYDLMPPSGEGDIYWFCIWHALPIEGRWSHLWAIFEGTFRRGELQVMLDGLRDENPIRGEYIEQLMEPDPSATLAEIGRERVPEILQRGRALATQWIERLTSNDFEGAMSLVEPLAWPEAASNIVIRAIDEFVRTGDTGGFHDAPVQDDYRAPELDELPLTPPSKMSPAVEGKQVDVGCFLDLFEDDDPLWFSLEHSIPLEGQWTNLSARFGGGVIDGRVYLKLITVRAD